jgi:hypothetical protein
VPPRYAYWTILIDNTPTAFRSRDQAELLPTLNQLRRKSSNVVMKWFARGRLWDTPEQAQWAGKNMNGSTEKRGKEWRPGGQHKDPRARFDKRKDTPKKDHRPPWSDKPPDVAQISGPAREKPAGAAQVGRSASGTPFPPAHGKKPFRPAHDTKSFRPAHGKTSFRPTDRKTSFRPADGKTSFRPAQDRKSFRPADKKHDRPWKPDRPWRDKPGGSQGQRPWQHARNPLPGRPGADQPHHGKPDVARAGRPGHAKPVPDAGHGGRDKPARRRPWAGKNAAPDAAKGGAGQTPRRDNATPWRPPGRRDAPVHPSDAQVALQRPGGEEGQIDPKPGPADRGDPRTKDN